MNSRRSRKSKPKRIFAILVDTRLGSSEINAHFDLKRCRTLLEAYRWGQEELAARPGLLTAEVMILKTVDVIKQNYGRYRPRRVR